MNTPSFTVPEYKRSQVDWTLWEVMNWRQMNRPTEEIALDFRNRLKRLLELDTVIVKSEIGPTHAFSAEPPGGYGVDRQFSLFDVFHLGVALQLIDTGFNQKEVVFFLQHIRNSLIGHFPTLLKYPLCQSEKGADKEKYPKLPKSLDGEYADPRVFLVITKIEMCEIYRTNKRPVILAPRMCFGAKELATFINKEAHRYPNHIVIEIAQLCAWVGSEIHNAPIAKRGRKAKPTVKEKANVKIKRT